MVTVAEASKRYMARRGARKGCRKMKMYHRVRTKKGTRVAPVTGYAKKTCPALMKHKKWNHGKKM